MEKRKRARLIYNPTSGQEIMKKNVAEVLDILESYGYETSAFQTTPAKDSAKSEATRAAKAGFDLVIAAGGDGTINEVVNGIAPLRKRPKMAIRAHGTYYSHAVILSKRLYIKSAPLFMFHTHSTSLGRYQLLRV